MKQLSVALLLIFLITLSIKSESVYDSCFIETSSENISVTCRSCGNCDCRSSCPKYKKCKAFCALLTRALRVDGNTVLNGNVTINGPISAGNTDVNDLTVNGTFTTLGPVNMGTDDTADLINIGTGGDNRTVTIGNTNTGSETLIFGDPEQINGITLNAFGNVRVVPFNVTAGPSPFAVTGRVGRLIITGLAAAPGGTTADIVITNDVISNLSTILIGSFSITGTEDAQMSLKRAVLTTDTLTFNLRNNGTQNLLSNVNMVFWILN